MRAQYFAKEDLIGEPILSRMEGPVEDAMPQQDGAGKPIQVRSARWSGWLKSPMAGDYGFEASWPGARIVVSGADVSEPGKRIFIPAGRFVPIEVKLSSVARSRAMLRAGAPSDFSLSWIAPHGARYLVPRNAMFAPTDTVGSYKK